MIIIIIEKKKCKAHNLADSSSVNELRYRMFTKNNLREDRLPSTLDALVLNLRRALVCFH